MGRIGLAVPSIFETRRVTVQGYPWVLPGDTRYHGVWRGEARSLKLPTGGKESFQTSSDETPRLDAGRCLLIDGGRSRARPGAHAESRSAGSGFHAPSRVFRLSRD